MKILFIFYVLISILTFSLVVFSRRSVLSVGVVLLYSIIAVCFFSISSGTKGIRVDTDIYQYISSLEFMRNRGFEAAVESFRYEVGFIVVTWLFSLFDDNLVFLIGVPALQIVGLLLFISRKLRRDTFIIVAFCYISYFLTYNLSVNILRQGIALPICLVSIHFMLERRFLISLLLVIAAALFHSTALILIFPLIICVIGVELRHVMVFWISCIIISYLNLAEDFIRDFLGSVGVSSLYNHIIDNESVVGLYKVGFRIDFVLFGSLPVFLYFLLYYLNYSISNHYKKWLSVYLMLNSISILMSFIPFNDRVATYSWYIIPFVLGYALECSNGFYDGVRGESDDYMFISNFFKYRKLIFFVIAFLLGFFSFLYHPTMQLTSKEWY